MSFKAGRWRVAWRVNVPTVLDVCLMARVDGGQRAAPELTNPWAPISAAYPAGAARSGNREP